MYQNPQFISVIIAVYNGEAYLGHAVKSVQDQSHSPMEVIIVDDGSTDKTSEIIKKLSGIQYIHQQNQGAASALNRGISAARGNFLAFLDADDIWMPSKTKLQLEEFNKHPELDMVFGHHVQLYSGRNGGEKLPALFKGAMLIRTESFHRVGTFSTKWKVGEFIDWYQRAREIGLKSAVIPGIVMKRRIHEGNTSYRNRKEFKDYVDIVKASLDRKRLNIKNG